MIGNIVSILNGLVPALSCCLNSFFWDEHECDECGECDECDECDEHECDECDEQVWIEFLEKTLKWF